MNTNAMIHPEIFFGEVNIGKLEENFCAFFTLSAGIRQRLGERKYLLDDYLLRLLNATLTVSPEAAAQEGYDSTDDLYGFVNQVLQGTKPQHPTRMGDIVREYINENPLPYREHDTKVAVYMTGLFHRYLEYAVGRYNEQIAGELCLSFNSAQVGRLFETITGIIGGEADMVRLNALFTTCFLRIKPLELYLQGIIADLVDTLIYRDTETDHTILQLLLEQREAVNDASPI